MVMRGRQLNVEHLRPGAVSQRRFGRQFGAMAYKAVERRKRLECKRVGSRFG